ncbi:MAG TPA: hypothetical protein PK624_07380 [Spirochaetota bacterium]|nr:hypothetical protein [Spirochaetota bacterium]HPK56017.1 hypothetical protein [Spirochaetota bacterium]
MKKNKLLLLTLILLPLFFTSSCGDDPLITELVENRVKVLLKGTFESDDSVPAWSVSGPSVFYLDISEIRADGDKFANYRYVDSIPLNETNGFFNGQGLNYKSDDLYIDEKYDNLQLYIRKMGFDNVSPSTNTFYFNGKDVPGYDFNLKQIYLESGPDEDDTNLVFPLLAPVAGSINYDGEGEWVVEVRVVIKNNIKQYSTSDGITFWAIEDNINDVSNESSVGYIGGNLAAIAYAYKKDYTGTITVPSATDYLVAIPAEDDISEYVSGKIPPYITNQTGVLKNIPVGVPMNVFTTSLSQTNILKQTTSTHYIPVATDVILTVPEENASY